MSTNKMGNVYKMWWIVSISISRLRHTQMSTRREIYIRCGGLYQRQYPQCDITVKTLPLVREMSKVNKGFLCIVIFYNCIQFSEQKFQLKIRQQKLCFVENVLSPVTFRSSQLPIFRGTPGGTNQEALCILVVPTKKDSKVSQGKKPTGQDCFATLI